MRRIAIVGCGSQKLDRKAPARDLYASQLFRKSFEYAVRVTGDERRVFIASAFHHLVRANDMICPYERRLSDLGGKAERQGWASRCFFGLAYIWLPWLSSIGVTKIDEIVILAGKEYADPLRREAELEGFRVLEPLRGLGIGQRQEWLNRELGDVGPAAHAPIAPARQTVSSKSGHCLCGCGTGVKSRFVTGHDAKLHSLVLRIARGEAAKDALPGDQATREYLRSASWVTDEMAEAVGL
jgi:hypothetical protein